jgi:hypothetical protein
MHLNDLLHSLPPPSPQPYLRCVIFTKGLFLNGRSRVHAIEGSMLSRLILVATRMPNLKCAASARQRRYRDAVTRLASEYIMDMQQRGETWQEPCRMSFGVAMAPLYISTLLSGSATRHFHYDEDGTDILHPIREAEMLQLACFTVSPTAVTLF